MDFSMVLFLATAVTGLIWLWDASIGAPGRRRRGVDNLVTVESSSGSSSAPSVNDIGKKSKNCVEGKCKVDGKLLLIPKNLKKKVPRLRRNKNRKT